jgi:hypothetical protein
MPDETLAEMEEAAQKLGLTVNEFIVEAIRERIAAARSAKN